MDLPLSEFSKNKSKEDGLQPRCRACTKLYFDKYRMKNKDKLNAASRGYYYKNEARLRRHGLDRLTYEAMPKVCAICGSAGDGRWKTLNIDHDHATGQVRGLLCLKCNAGLGNFRDDPMLLARASEYLRKTLPDEAVWRPPT